MRAEVASFWRRLMRRPDGDPAARVDREIRDELELHLELRTADNITAGMTPDQARRAARERFGDLERILREGRQVRLDAAHPLGRFPHRTPPERARATLMSDFLYDLQYAVRMLAKSPGFTLVAVLSLALGIGFNSTVFSVVDAVMFKPPAYEDPDRLVRIGAGEDVFGGIFQSYPDFHDLREQAESFVGVAAWRTEMTTYNHDGNAEFVFGESVVAELFDLLGIHPLLGRTFAPDEDDHPGGDHVVMVSERFWRSRLGADPDAIGRALLFAGRPFTLIGVVPRTYTGGTPPIAVNFWLPVSNVDTLLPTGTGLLDRRGSHSFSVIGRLKPGVGLEGAEQEVRAISTALAAEYPETNDETVFTLIPATDVRIDPAVDRAVLPAGGVLMGVVGLVLLISCANLANMMLARGSARQQEVAVRQALGASRWRLVRQLLTESLLLAALGGVLAMAVAAASLGLLQAIKPPVMIPLDLSVPIDPRVLGFTALLSLVAGVAFGLIPALRATRTELTGALKAEDARGGGSARGNGLRSALVVVQVAVSLVLMISASLLARSLINAQTIDPGIVTDSVVSIVPGVAFQGYDAERARDFHRQAIERIQALPGVQLAAFAERLPLESMTVMDRDIWFEDRPLGPDEDPPGIMSAAVSPSYFDVLGIGVTQGRLITDQDIAESPPVAVVNREFADRFWPGDNPLGKLLSVAGAEGPWIEVVGVNAPHKISTLGEEPTPHMYLPYEQSRGPGLGSIVARIEGDAGAALEGMRRAVREIDPNLAIMETKTIQQHLAVSLFPVRLAAAALGLLGAIGALLAALGVYGVVSFGVARRTHEIGIRMAVGSDRASVVRLVLRQGMKTVVIGAVLGLAASLAFTRVLGTLLYGVASTDVLAFGAAALALLGVAAVANVIPARRASRVNPTTALRAE